MRIEVRYADLARRRALVTGASSGIGLGVARAFLEQGMRVAAHYRSGRAAVESLRASYGDSVAPIQADLAPRPPARAVPVERVRGMAHVVRTAAWGG